MIAISIASILYGGLVALGQSDIKKLIAYSSVAHMGFVTLGIFLFSLQGVQGAIFQMLNHGIITGALFMMIGAVYERSHSREISLNQGLGKYLPHFMFFWGLFGFASFGFPGTNGFVGEFLVLAAAFKYKTAVGLLCIPGALISAAYILKVTLRMAWGEPSSAADKNWLDLKKKEWVYLVVPAVLVIFLGLAPTGFLDYISPTINATLESFDARKAQSAEGTSAVDKERELGISQDSLDTKGSVSVLPQANNLAIKNSSELLDNWTDARVAKQDDKLNGNIVQSKESVALAALSGIVSLRNPGLVPSPEKEGSRKNGVEKNG
jgi:NADH:ubiquinone oxidoreductase subunit 5 (subunit L)/multisubunit Na+/H+ antiporter MnhA subunit